MSLRSRLNRVAKRLGADGPEPGTEVVVINVCGPGMTPHRIERTNSAGQRVLDICFDPEKGPELPPGHFMLVAGVDPVDLV